KTADNAHPDANEQQMLWLMNRARSNPAEEGEWLATTDIPNIAFPRSYFGVDVAVLQNEFVGYDQKPPAAFDVRLYNAAKAHSDAQDHNDQFRKISDAGFSYTQARGNVFSYTKDALYGHAAFNIDWGYGTDGMQDGRGHRMAIMSIDGDYTNVGLAIVPESDSATEVGPLVTTGNYCNANRFQPNHYNRFIVGTVWDDVNGNEMYDPGEGIGNVTVMPDSGTYYAVTSDSGGYAVPIISAGACTITFSGALNAVRNVTVGDESILFDLVSEPSCPSELYVSSTGDCGNKSPCYSSIKDAIDNAAAEAVIFVKQGTYQESINMGEGKSLLIKGGYNDAYDQQTANATFIQAVGSTSIKSSGGSLQWQMVAIK
ncbi:MAG: hypothetical protein KQJ78_25305, partial [Deltaproteobacteria bacterium]|nr:hypothetical protein [Deltaproteobacteria bacterium]